LSNIREITGTLYLEHNGIKTAEAHKNITAIGTLKVCEQNLKEIILPELESLKNLSITYSHDTIAFPKFNGNKLDDLTLVSTSVSKLFLPGITEIGNLEIYDCTPRSIAIFSSLHCVRDLKIINVNVLRSVLFPELESVVNLEVNNSFLTDFGWMPKIKSGGQIEIANNQFLTSLDGLENLNTVSQSVSITENTKLSDFCALKNLVTNSPSVNLNVSGNSKNPSAEEILNCGE
jgi:hypothetical protein